LIQVKQRPGFDAPPRAVRTFSEVRMMVKTPVWIVDNATRSEHCPPIASATVA
jgi:hypothetical protein